MVQTFNPKTKEAKQWVTVNLRLGWSTQQNMGQPRLYGNTLSQKENNFNEIQNENWLCGNIQSSPFERIRNEVKCSSQADETVTVTEPGPRMNMTGKKGESQQCAVFAIGYEGGCQL